MDEKQQVREVRMNSEQELVKRREHTIRDITRILASFYPWEHAKALYDAGYRKVHELRRLSEAEIRFASGIRVMDIDREKLVAKAQLNSIKKQIEEANR